MPPGRQLGRNHHVRSAEQRLQQRRRQQRLARLSRRRPRGRRRGDRLVPLLRPDPGRAEGGRRQHGGPQAAGRTDARSRRLATARREGGYAIAALVVGALLALAIGIGWYVWSGQSAVPTTPAAMELNLKLPPAPSLPDPAPMPNPGAGG